MTDSVLIPVPEIRDYERINAEILRLLEEGQPSILLAGVDGQRLLVSGLRGAWEARVTIDGDAGPELAAGLEAPGLLVHCLGSSADGAGSGLVAGRIYIDGDSGEATGYGQKGGLIVVRGAAGHRAGLRQAGGELILLGGAGRLAGDRQSGGIRLSLAGANGTDAGHGRLGGDAGEIPAGVDFPRDDPEALDWTIRTLVAIGRSRR